MTASAGKRIGRYDIASPLGAGGMGEVFLARDTQLDRNVALKLLSEEFTRNEDRMKRFVQEARINGAHTVELNLEPSEGATLFAEKIYGAATSEVPAFVDRILAAR